MGRDSEATAGPRFPSETRLNFAENLLHHGDDGTDVLFRGEHGVRSKPPFAALCRAVARIAQVADIPRTRSGKVTELTVCDIVHGRIVANIETLSDPDALDDSRYRPDLEN